jgi:hypothetical protein
MVMHACHNSKHMSVMNFCNASKQKVMTSFWESLLAMKPGCTTNWKQIEWARNGVIPHHQKPRSFRRSHLQGRLCSLLGQTRRTPGTLHTSGELYLKCLKFRSLEESSSACSQIKVLWTVGKWCPFATLQWSAPYWPCNSCNNPRLALRASSTSVILTRPSPKWLLHVWATQRVDTRKEVLFWWRGTADGAWVVA